jgi:hypothetical protein
MPRTIIRTTTVVAPGLRDRQRELRRRAPGQSRPSQAAATITAAEASAASRNLGSLQSSVLRGMWGTYAVVQRVSRKLDIASGTIRRRCPP